ncbi:MAG: MBL fold metallo-hydrolase [Endozoicomonas sp.]
MSRSILSPEGIFPTPLSFHQLSGNACAFTSAGLPNTGVVIGVKSVLVFSPQASPEAVAEIEKQIKRLTHVPVRYLVLSDLHSITRPEESAFPGAVVIASHATDEAISEREAEEWRISVQRFPVLQGMDGSRGKRVIPEVIVDECLMLELGNQRVLVFHPGAGHTGGDTVLWVPDQKILFSGGLVVSEITPFCGDAYLHQWTLTLKVLAEFEPLILLPGSGQPVQGREASLEAIEYTRGYVSRLYCYVSESIQKGGGLTEAYHLVRDRMNAEYGTGFGYERFLPFNVSRAIDEASGVEQPQPWTVEKEQALWQSLGYL